LTISPEPHPVGEHLTPLGVTVAVPRSTPETGRGAPLVGRVRRLFGAHLRDRRFWAIQALVLAIAIGHITLEIGGSLLGWPSFYLIPVSLFFIPCIYASVAYGEQGAILTVLWCWVLSLPSIIVYHTHAEQVGVNLQLAIMLVTALLVGRSVDRERRAHSEAVAVNAQLRELNATAAAASRSLDLEQVFADTLQVIVGRQPVGSAWIVYAPESGESRTVVACSGTLLSARELPPARLAATLSVIARGEPCSSADGDGMSPTCDAQQTTVIVPVTVGGNVVGGLGVAGPREIMLTHDLVQLEAVARQLGLAVDNSGHFEAAASALRELAASQNALQKYIQLATDAQEEERKRLARELHDETIQMLVVARGSLEVASRQPLSSAASVTSTIATLDGAIAELRRVCRDLRPSILDDLGLIHALEALTVELADRADMQVTVTCECDERRLDAQTEVVLYRIAQEALHNIERHSAATHASVTLIAGPDAVALRVTDNGRGFRPQGGGSGPAESAGLGLLGMQERARSLGGVLMIESSPGAGSLIEVRAPVR
jgi:signal transduction histidine kinase